MIHVEARAVRRVPRRRHDDRAHRSKGDGVSILYGLMGISCLGCFVGDDCRAASLGKLHVPRYKISVRMREINTRNFQTHFLRISEVSGDVSRGVDNHGFSATSNEVRIV